MSDFTIGALHMAAASGDLEMVKLAIQRLVNKNPRKKGDETLSTPLHLAARGGHLHIVKFLAPLLEDKLPEAGKIRYQKAGNRSFHGMTPLHEAAINGHLSVVEYLCSVIDDGNINPQRDGENIATLAAYSGHLDIVCFYTEKLEDKNPRVITDTKFNGRTPLHDASQKGHLRIVQHLTNLLEDKNPGDAYGHTPLHLAASSGHLAVVKHLVQFIDDPHPKNGDYWGKKTPIQRAEENGHDDIVEFLSEFQVLRFMDEKLKFQNELCCPVCLDVPLPPKKIFQCSQGHTICDECLSRIEKRCPTCRESWENTNLPVRNRMAESMVFKISRYQGNLTKLQLT